MRVCVDMYVYVQVDVWSYGMVLVEMVNRTLPFPGYTHTHSRTHIKIIK
jgi:serine/threonine protein kinase